MQVSFHSFMSLFSCHSCISLFGCQTFQKRRFSHVDKKKKADSYYEGASIRAVDYWNLKKVAREIRKGAREDSDVFCSSVSVFHSLSFFPGIFVRARSLGISWSFFKKLSVPPDIYMTVYLYVGVSAYLYIFVCNVYICVYCPLIFVPKAGYYLLEWLRCVLSKEPCTVSRELYIPPNEPTIRW